MSQDQLFGESLLCHSIVKYSWSVGPRSAKDTDWTHVASPNLSVLVQHIQFGSAIVLRVIQDTTDLEYLQITAYVKEANAFRQRHNSAHLDDLPIFAMSKGTALAIRYICKDNRVRRFQLRFADQASCQELAQLLTHHGLKFGKPHTGPNSVQPQVRPTSTGSYSQSSYTAPVSSSTITVPHIRDQSQHGVTEQQSNYHPDMSSPSYRTCPEPASSRTATPSRKPTFIGDHHYGMTEQQAHFNFDKFPSPSKAVPSSPPRLPTSRNESVYERPMSAPDQEQPTALEAMLPPRRELPFPRPSTSSGIPGNPSSGSKARASKAFTPLPTPSYARNLRSSSTLAHLGPENRASTPSYAQDIRPSSSMRPPSPVNDESTSTLNYEPNDVCPTPHGGRITRLSTPRGPTKLEMPTRRTYDPRKESYHADVANFLSSHSTTGGETGSLLMTSDFSENVQTSSPVRALRTSPVRIMPNVQDLNVSKVDNASPDETGDQEQLRRYSEQTPEVRMDILNDFLIAHLDDAEFLSLCEDVGACWRRKVLDRRD